MTKDALEGRSLGEARRELIRDALMQSGAVTVRELQSRFGISGMTVRRDLEALERRGAARRTHGGAVLPAMAAADDSFAQRLGVATDAKARLAEAAAGLVRDGETIFLDASSTAFFMAARIAQLPTRVRVITNSAAAMQVLGACEDGRVEVYATGGMLQRVTSSYVGPSSVRAIREHFADRLFMSATSVTSGGILTESDSLEAAVKRAMLDQSAESVLLVDDSKLSTHGKHVVGSLAELSLVLADGLSDQHAEWMRADGLAVRVLGSTADA
jgi:DeoR/GlpR family transcriptional regulator of sugar metabolism